MIVKDAGTKLVIEIDKETELRPSKTGNTLIVASSHGNTVTSVMVNGHPVRVGVNAFIPAPTAPAGNAGNGSKGK